MKKMTIALVAMLTIAVTGKAMSYEQARNEALFLTDKMAYELNLTEEQYEAAYEINLDYLMGVTSYDDVYGTYWERRNLDLSYILLDWQLSAFRAATYFYRPLYWRDGFWHFAIYARYPHRDYFYYGRPVFYASYRGGHAWHVVGGRGWYHGRRDHYIHHHTSRHFGMRDGWNRGDYRHHHNGTRNSSTRTTVNHRDHNRGDINRGHNNHNRDFNRDRDHNRNHNRDINRGNGGNRDHNRGDMNRGGNNRPSTPNTTPSTNNHSTRSLGGYRSGGNSPRTSGNIGGNTPRSNGGSGMRNGSTGMRSGGSGGMRSGGSGGMRSGGSFGGGHSSAGRGSFGGGHSGGGGHRDSIALH